MTIAPPTRTADLRSSDLRTKRETFGVYIRRPSARVFLLVAVVLVAVRPFAGGLGRGDLLVIAATALLAGPIEWFIHEHLLHAEEDAWTTRRLGTGTNHRQHHVDPTELDTLLLTGLDAAVFVTVFGIFTAGWVVPLVWITNSAILGSFVTAWALAAIGLAHYEWVHLLVHTRYRCTSRYYKRLARNHRLHHFRNENYWLGVTTNSGDRLLRTYPKQKTDVPLSDTARTLGAVVDAA